MASHMRAMCSRNQPSINKKQELFCMSIISLFSCPLGVLPVASSMNGSQIDTESQKYSLSVIAAIILSVVGDVFKNFKHLQRLRSSYMCDAVNHFYT
ncbi:hypothetical protein COOONC_19935 [Cooperia oncophora]